MASSNSLLVFLLSLSCAFFFSCKGQGEGHVSGCVLVDAYICFCLQCGAVEPQIEEKVLGLPL